MKRFPPAVRVPLLACAALCLLCGCASTTAPGREYTRRGIEREYASSPAVGSPRGRQFEDIIPVGARITAVHVSQGEGIEGIHLSYERNGGVRQTPHRGSSGRKVEVFKLDRDEKIVGIHGWGKGAIDGLAIATNKQTKSFGRPSPAPAASEAPWHAMLTEEQVQRYVGIGITGRADTQLCQLSLRIQIRGEADERVVQVTDR
jgi:hypothetical protein